MDFNVTASSTLQHKLKLGSVYLFFILLLFGCNSNLLPNPTTSVKATPAATLPLPTPKVTRLETPGVMPQPTFPFASPEYGIQAFMWWKPDQAEKDLALIQEMGFGWVKQDFPWREIEGIEKGSHDEWRPDFIVDAVENAGLKLVARLDRQPFWSQSGELKVNKPPDNPQDFGDFCGWMAHRYQGRIAAYQVWNEPNLSREWGDESPSPVEYTALLKACYEGIKANDPQAIVISAGLAPTGTQPPIAMPDTDFLQGMYDAGAAPYFDVLGLNAPGYAAAPELSPERAEEQYNGRFFTFRRVEDMRTIMVANGDEAKQAAILEMGWTMDEIRQNYAWFRVDEQTQADYLVRAYGYAGENWQPWIGLMSTIYIAKYDWTAEENEEYWWSIVRPGGEKMPAFYALKEMPK